MPRYAAVDIGSNSVRMMAAEVSAEGTKVLAQDRVVTRLGESVFRSGKIGSDALDLLCSTLQRMAATYQKLDVLGVRAVATSAVRDASNQQEFSTRVAKALGNPVEVISGQEEARLIHLGVEARWPRPEERTLIVDLGGGSAELIISQDGKMVDADSRPLGAVRLNALLIESDPPSPADLDRLNQYIDEKLAPFVRRHRDERFDRVVATSSTPAALVCAANRIPRAERDSADRMRASTSQIRRLFNQLVQENVESRRRWVGIGPRRAEIIIGGAAVFVKVLETFGQPALYYSAAGVRDGIIADLAARGVGRDRSRLSREQRDVVEALSRRYGVELKHARHVAALASDLFESLQPVHRLPASAGKLLEASSYLHDIGHYVSDTSHHKHSAYLVANSDLPGFTNHERLAIAALCRFHRKSLPQARHAEYQTLDADSKRAVLYLAPILRLADALDRSQEQKVRTLSAATKSGAITLTVEAEPLADLELWAAGELANVFRDVYAHSLTVRRAKL